MNRPMSGLFALAVAVVLSACGGDGGTGPDPNPGNDGGGNGDARVIVTDPAFSSVIQEIFTRKGCTDSSCHGSTQEAGLDLRSGSSHTNLVNVASTQAPGVLRVIPGNANGSYLIVKVEGRQTVGVRMPSGGVALDNIDLTNLKNWINQGAKNN